ncbi:Asp23/Gls24 family envelope stress response protein [Saccharopolyspora mangrovi]|uniref:Asp23/Gls24 family envelope stress response protein n=1 Tax=Saccharopolyspora mangrovi TaxID=3082379 RepID=A0ABU6AFB0_9PSEU|nr:Asp23/Gls24 family envelope stress response protein [Saccharopolyspora sp. S2-29]MEB3370079.1 Asp23/Gls24 family envelope stress response protein [Saccharopolyspora sp. S2-29]
MAEKTTGTQSTEAVSSESSWTTTTPRSGAEPARRVGETTPAEEGQKGRTTIAAAVVQQIARIATEEISGVYAMGGGMARAFGAIRERIPGASASQTSGVTVEVGERQAAIDLEIVVEYGAALKDLARGVRRNVITAVERMTGLEVVEVNIAVNDIHLAGEDEQSAAQTRVE